MTAWDATSCEAKETLLGVLRQEAEGFFALAAAPGAWEAPTACPEWQVRDLVGHLIDVTEGYFVGFDAARAGSSGAPPLGLAVMQKRLDEQARSHRELGRDVALQRLRGDFDRLLELCSGLGADDWGGLLVPHAYMGPLPAYFYPVFQLMDYGVHAWDIRQGTGRAHGLRAETADLLVPFMFVLWQYTTNPVNPADACDIGIRITSGPNAGDTRVSVGEDGFSYAAGSVDDITTLEFDPGSFVLTTFGRSNAGTIRGERTIADRYLNLFFRI